jgi:hypothetical protein
MLSEKIDLNSKQIISHDIKLRIYSAHVVILKTRDLITNMRLVVNGVFGIKIESYLHSVCFKLGIANHEDTFRISSRKEKEDQ